MFGNVWKRWNWLEGGLVPLASAAVRVAWITPLVRLVLNNVLVAPMGTVYPSWLILGLLIGASLLRHVLQERRGWRWLMMGIGFWVVVTVLTALFSFDTADPGRWLAALYASLTDFRTGIPATLLVILITALLWRRGLLMEWTHYDELWRSFVIGVAVLGFLLLLPQSMIPSAVAMALQASMGLFLLTGLLALALVAVAETLAVERSRGSTTPPLNRYWLVAVGSVIVVVLLGGWLVGQVLSPGTVAEMWRRITPILDAILDAFLYILMAISYLLFLLIEPLFRALQAKIGSVPTPEPGNMGRPPEMEFPERVTRALSPGITDALRIILVLALVAVVLALFFRAARRLRRRSPEEMVEERESVFSRALLGQQLRNLLRRRPRPASLFLDLAGLEEPRRTIRLLYQQLLATFSALGHPRPAALTPIAYRNMLEGFLPTEHEALGRLTAAYLQARYAAETPTQDQVEEAKEALERIEGVMKAGDVA